MAGKSKETILVVDDAPVALRVIKRNLMSEKYEVLTATNVAGAVQTLEAGPVDLVITDLKMPKVGGLDLVRHVHANFEDTAVIMITGYASIETAVQALREGAENYLPKPFTDEELLAAVRSALDRLHARRAAHAERPPPAGPALGLIGESQAMQDILTSIRKAAATDATVLITGESGTGKELVARAIHYSGPRASAAFVAVNCAGIPDGLVESELFGHVKGAFTGAVATRAGFFMTADLGTVFLDEISELTLAAQAKLLRVLEHKEVQMVGASRPQAVDVRVIAATNKDLHVQVSRQDFRDDLFFRLNILAIDLPPLRERGDDILLLIQHFNTKYAKQSGRPPLQFSDAVLDVLRGYHWPGNVRELQNLIQRLAVMSDRESVSLAQLPSLMRFSASSRSEQPRSLADAEASHIRTVLRSVNDNKTRAAEVLKISRKALRDKLKRYGLEPPA